MSRLSKVVGAGLLLLAHTVHAQIISPPTLTASGVQVFCQGYQPFVSFVLPVVTVDRGRPGAIFVGMRDQAGTAALFLQGDNWMPWESGMFPVYLVRNEGVSDQKFTLPLNGNLAGGGWMLYVGYGVLTSEAEGRVQSYVATVQKTEQLVNKKLNSVEPDHYRRSFIQDDLVRKGKYTYINTGVENNPRICLPESS